MKTQSPVTAAEQKAFAAFRADMNALPPADSNERAKAHRQVHLRHADSLERRARLEHLFRELGLDF